MVEIKLKMKELETKLQTFDNETVVIPFQNKLQETLEKYEK